MEWKTEIAKVKERVSVRGIVMTILSLVVAGLAIATLQYKPSVPDVGPVSPGPTTTAVPANAPWLEPGPAPGPAPAPAVTTPVSPAAASPTAAPTAGPPPSATPAPAPTATVRPTQTYIPTQTYVPAAPAPAPAPASSSAPTSAPPTSNNPFSGSRDTNPTELPNGGRRFGTVQQ